VAGRLRRVAADHARRTRQRPVPVALTTELNTRAVERGPKLLTELSESQRKLALERFRLLQPCLDNGASVMALAREQHHPPPLRDPASDSKPSERWRSYRAGPDQWEHARALLAMSRRGRFGLLRGAQKRRGRDSIRGPLAFCRLQRTSRLLHLCAWASLLFWRRFGLHLVLRLVSGLLRT
jgi:hypothetical protein